MTLTENVIQTLEISRVCLQIFQLALSTQLVSVSIMYKEWEASSLDQYFLWLSEYLISGS